MTKKKTRYAYNGKKFEEDFRKSVPMGVFCHRLRDNAQNWAKVSNICDFFLYKTPILYMLELKATKGKSLPFSNIRPNQLKGMLNATQEVEGVVAGFLITFYTVERTFFIEVEKANNYIELNKRKSFPINWLEKNGIELKQKKKISRYTFDIDTLIEDIRRG